MSDDKKENKYPLRMWLEKHNFMVSELDPETEDISIRLEGKYKIKEIGKGAGETDIKLIAYAKLHNKTVITMEKEQKQPPQDPSSYRVPLICHEEEVKYDTFVGFLAALEISI